MLLAKLRRHLQGKTAKGSSVSESLVIARKPDDPSSEAYRALRTKLLYAFVDTSPKVLMITSPNRGEGKTTTCANLGVALSQVNKSTLVVDCDLRKPAMHKVFGLHNQSGLVDVLIGERTLQEVCHEPFPGLKVLPAGPAPPHPDEFLGSTQFTEFIDQIHRQFKYVLVDVPPLQVVSDTLVIARQSDGVVLVLDAQDTRKSSTRWGVRELEAVGARILGMVVNNARVPTAAHYW